MQTVILDFETSGLNQYHDDIIEIGAKLLNCDNKFSVLLRPNDFTRNYFFNRYLK